MEENMANTDVALDAEVEPVTFTLDELEAEVQQEGQKPTQIKEEVTELASPELKGEQEEVKVEEQVEESEEDDSQEQFGNRAQKRIRRLVSDRKGLVEENSRLANELGEARARLSNEATRVQTSEEHAVLQHEARLTETESRLRSQWQEAHNEGNSDSLWDIQKGLAQVEAERLRLEEYKVSRPQPTQSQEQREQPQEQPPQQRQQEPDAQSLRWFEQNHTWFQQDPEMTSEALEIHRDLVNEGYNPLDAAEDDKSFNNYYRELNSRLKRTYPVKFQTQAQQRVAGPTRSTNNKKQITLSPSEITTAQNLGVPLKEYALQKRKLLIERGEL